MLHLRVTLVKLKKISLFPEVRYLTKQLSASPLMFIELAADLPNKIAIPPVLGLSE
jgi:hypothetical protein